MSTLLDTLHVPLSLEMNYPPLVKSSSIDYLTVFDSLKKKLSEYPSTMLLNEFCQKFNQKKPLYHLYNDEDGFIKCVVTMSGQKFASIGSHIHGNEAKNDAAGCVLFDIFNNPDGVYIEISHQNQVKTYVTRLNELCQLRSYKQPKYNFEKSLHSGGYRCDVLIAGVGSFRSKLKFTKKQESKEDIARLAYENLI